MSDVRYRIGQAAARSGLSVHTLRVWERRYGAVRPERTEKGGRLYRPADVERLKQLGALTRSGHSISQLAALADDELGRLVSENRLDRGRGKDAQSLTGFGNALRDEILAAVEVFDAERIDRLLRRIAVALSPREFVTEVISPLLHDVGQRWSEGELGIRHEHLLSNLVRETLIPMTRLTNTKMRGSVVVATLQGERHELGALGVSAVASAMGYHVYYLGTDLPAEEIASSAQSCGARSVLLSSSQDIEKSVQEELGKLEAKLPSHIGLVLGGRSASDLRPTRARALSFEELIDALETNAL